MRKIDTQKIQNIRQSVLDLNERYGLSNLTTARIAKNAGVSPATIYLHYQNKTDLLSRLYEEVKSHLHNGLAEAIDLTSSLDNQIRQALAFSVDQYHRYPKEYRFMSSLWSNPEMLDAHAIQMGNTMAGPLQDLFTRINADDHYATTSPAILASFLAIPSILLRQGTDLNEQNLQQTSDMILKAIQK